MWCSCRAILILGFIAFFLASICRAGDWAAPTKPHCPPATTVVEETVMKEVTKFTCKWVPDVKKVRRTVYECREEPICLPRCGHCSLFGHKPGCAECDRCEPPRMRRVLVKREIVEEKPTCKCVLEEVKEVIPVKVYRQVPCSVPAHGK